MNRRAFMSLLGGAAAWPLVARAQQPALPVIGLLSSRAPGDAPHLLAAIRQGLKTQALSRVRTSRSNFASPGIKANSCPHWRPIWFIVR
jgi:hypothetical protein